MCCPGSSAQVRSSEEQPHQSQARVAMFFLHRQPEIRRCPDSRSFSRELNSSQGMVASSLRRPRRTTACRLRPTWYLATLLRTSQGRTCPQVQVTRPASRCPSAAQSHPPPPLQRNLLPSLDSKTKKMPVIQRKLENTKVSGWREPLPGTWCDMSEAPPAGPVMTGTRVQASLWGPGHSPGTTPGPRSLHSCELKATF